MFYTIDSTRKEITNQRVAKLFVMVRVIIFECSVLCGGIQNNCVGHESECGIMWLKK